MSGKGAFDAAALLPAGMLLIGSVIANPLGDDAEDFPSTMFLEEFEDEVLAVATAVEQFDPSKILTQKTPPVKQS